MCKKCDQVICAWGYVSHRSQPADPALGAHRFDRLTDLSVKAKRSLSNMSFIFVAIHNYDNDVTTCLAVELLHLGLELGGQRQAVTCELTSSRDLGFSRF